MAMNQQDENSPPTKGQTNMALWNEVSTTDPAFTKKFDTGSFKGTSVNAQYLFQKATEMFGPAGIGWGYDLISSGFVDGVRMVIPAHINNAGEIIRPEQDFGCSQIHTARVRFWYVFNGQRGEVFGTGHTPFRYITRGNVQRVVVDAEYEKKSITDAVTKAMSLLGFGADIRMGMYDQPGYAEEVEAEIAVERAADREAEMVNQKHEFEEWLKKTIGLMSTATSLHELEILYKTGRVRVQSSKWSDETAKKKFEDTKNVRARDLMRAQGAKKEKTK